MMARTKVTLNSTDLGKILKSDAVRAALLVKGRRVEGRLKSTVPVVSGDLRKSITLKQDTTKSRARVRIILGTPYGAVVAATNPVVASSLDAAKGG